MKIYLQLRSSLYFERLKNISQLKIKNKTAHHAVRPQRTWRLLPGRIVHHGDRGKLPIISHTWFPSQSDVVINPPCSTSKHFFVTESCINTYSSSVLPIMVMKLKSPVTLSVILVWQCMLLSNIKKIVFVVLCQLKYYSRLSSSLCWYFYV